MKNRFSVCNDNNIWKYYRDFFMKNLLLVLTIASVIAGIVLGLVLRSVELSPVTIQLINFPGEIFMQVCAKFPVWLSFFYCVDIWQIFRCSKWWFFLLSSRRLSHVGFGIRHFEVLINISKTEVCDMKMSHFQRSLRWIHATPARWDWWLWHTMRQLQLSHPLWAFAMWILSLHVQNRLRDTALVQFAPHQYY